MSATVFVDTNVLVYARDRSEAKKQSAAADWMRELWREHRGRTSTQVLSEYYTAVTRKLDPGLDETLAWQDVRALLAWEPQPIDSDVLRRAREVQIRYAFGWWDSMIVAAAELQGCSVLLTEDLQEGFVCGSTTVVNPFATRVGEAQSGYESAAEPVSRHRRPGRPRRRTG